MTGREAFCIFVKKLMLVSVENPQTGERREQEVPAALIRDVIDGRACLYKGWKEHIAGSRTIEECRARSVLQSYIFSLLNIFLFKNLDLKLYRILGDEVGLYLEKGTILSLSKAVFSEKRLSKEGISHDYIKTVPEVVFEVDVNINAQSEMNFISRKIETLLAFGVKKVIWIFGENKTIIVAEPGRDWIMTNWSSDIEILNGEVLNLKKLHDEEQ